MHRPPFALFLVAILPVTSRQETAPDATAMAPPVGGAPPIACGENVAELDKSIFHIFQAKDSVYWFGSDGQGVYRYDGQSLIGFTIEHGLGGNHIRGIQEDHAGNIYVCSDPGGVSRFDGRAFRTLPVADADPARTQWRLEPDDLWFPAGQDSGAVYRYDGKSLYRLTFPNTTEGDAFKAAYPRSEYPNMKFSPYDVYTIFKDGKGHVWFGTSSLGACRYDGKSHAWAVRAEIHAELNFGVRAIVEDKDGKFWFSNTLNRYAVSPAAPTEQAAGELRLRAEPGVGDRTEGHSVFMSAVKDRNGDLWLATLDAGVWRYDGANMISYPVKHDDTSIWTYSIYQDRHGVLWVGTHEHGVYKFNGSTFEKFQP